MRQILKVNGVTRQIGSGVLSISASFLLGGTTGFGNNKWAKSEYRNQQRPRLEGASKPAAAGDDLDRRRQLLVCTSTFLFFKTRSGFRRSQSVMHFHAPCPGGPSVRRKVFAVSSSFAPTKGSVFTPYVNDPGFLEFPRPLSGAVEAVNCRSFPTLVNFDEPL
jgi:hypothetical protein